MIESQLTWTDNLISRVGGSDRYQLLLFINFSFKWLLCGMILFALNFFYFTPEFACTQQEMKGFPTCQQFVCNSQDPQFWYNHLQKPIRPSISLDYGYVMLCSDEWISSSVQAVGYVGSFIGYLLMSHLADNYGRKNIEHLSWGTNVVGLICLVASGNTLALIVIGTFLTGMGANAAVTLHYTFLKQFLVGKNRERSIIALQIMFSLGISIVSLLSMFIDNWKIIAGFCMLLPSLLLIPFSIYLLEETPNFILIGQGKAKLLQSLNRIAKINKNDPLCFQDLEFIEAPSSINNNQQKKVQKYSILTLFKYPSIRQITIICGIIDLIIQFVYDGTILSLDKIGVNVYWDQILVGLVEIFAALFCSWAIIKLQRRKFTKLSLSICGVLTFLIGILSLFFQHNQSQLNFHSIAEMVLLAGLRFVLNSVWGVFFVYIAELFPKSVTSLSFGYVSALGTVGASAAPYVRLFTAKMSMIFMAVCCFIGAFVVLKLKQTKGQPITQEIEQVQHEKKKSVVSESST